MAEEKTINLLWNCAKELTTQTHAECLLKSHYINTCRKMARHSVQLAEEIVGPARMCARCGNQWCHGNYRLQLRPQRLTNNAKRRRQIAQLDEVYAKREERGSLSRGARKRAKWLKKRMVSNIALNCEFCGHKTMLPMEKNKIRDKYNNTQKTMVATNTTTKIAKAVPATDRRNKKKKNKDINDGLKLQQQINKKTPSAPKKNTTNTLQTQSNKQNRQKSKATTSTPAVSTKATTASKKMQSKTQKQNALLQLAAQLKTHASKIASKTAQNRLQAFLK